MTPYVLRTIYFACFHVHLRYGLTLWGGDPESIRIFRLQKKVIRITGKVGRHPSCRNLFKDLNTLPLPCLYISRLCVVLNLTRKRLNITKKYMTTVHAKNQIFKFSSAELLFWRTIVQMWVENSTINCLTQ